MGILLDHVVSAKHRLMISEHEHTEESWRVREEFVSETMVGFTPNVSCLRHVYEYARAIHKKWKQGMEHSL